MSQPRISNFSIPSIRSSSYFRFVSILPDVYPWKSVQNWDHGYPSPVNTGGGTGNSRISFDHRAFRKSLSPARRTVRHWPILQTCPGFQFITGIPPQHYERTNRIRWPTPTTSPRIPQGIVGPDRLSDIRLSEIFFLVAPESHPIETLFNFSSTRRDKKRYFFDAR